MNRELRKKILNVFKWGWSLNMEILEISVICFRYKYPEYVGALNDSTIYKEIEQTIEQQLYYKLHNNLNNNQFLDLLQNLNFID